MAYCLPTARVTLRDSLRRLCLAAIATAAMALPAMAGPARAQETPAATPPAVELEVFVRDGCPYCAQAKRFLEKLQAEQPGLVVTIRDIWREPEALERLEKLVASAPGAGSGVPAIHVRGYLIIGYGGDETTGALIRQLVAGQPAPGGDGAVDPGHRADGRSPLTEAAKPQGVVDLPWIGKRVRLEDVGLPLFTITIGLLDGFNPCSMWVLILMISMLAAVGDRRRMVAIAGTFVLVQGIAYFVFMAAWLNLFLVIGLSRASEMVLGVIALVAGAINMKDFVAFGRGVSLSIPTSAKPGIYQRIRRLMNERSLAVAIGGTIVLGLLVQVVELVCTSGLPALYTRILTLSQLDPWTYYAYLLLYNLMYMVDDVMVLSIGVVTLSQHRLQEREGRALKLLSGLVMVGLGLYLLAPMR
jgi:glutaredoxin